VHFALSYIRIHRELKENNLDIEFNSLDRHRYMHVSRLVFFLLLLRSFVRLIEKKKEIHEGHVWTIVLEGNVKKNTTKRGCRRSFTRISLLLFELIFDFNFQIIIFFFVFFFVYLFQSCSQVTC